MYPCRLSCMAPSRRKSAVREDTSQDDGAGRRASAESPGRPFPFTSPRLVDMLKQRVRDRDRKSTRLNSSHSQISYAVFCLKKKKTHIHGRLTPPRVPP